MISIKTIEEIEIMKKAGEKLAFVMKQIRKEVKPGVSTEKLDQLAEKLILSEGSKPAFKNYKGFPASLCVSLNDEIVHGVPSERVIREGDLASLDLGLLYDGYASDMATTLAVGSVDPEVNRLIRVTKKSLKRAIARMKPNKFLGDVSCAVQNYVESQGFEVVRDLCGHGIGKRVHEDPDIPNWGQRHKGPKLKVGMVFAIEPMVVMGKPSIKLAKDGLTFKTGDGSLSAHFEHTVAITKKGPLILTQ